MTVSNSKSGKYQKKLHSTSLQEPNRVAEILKKAYYRGLDRLGYSEYEIRSDLATIQEIIRQANPMYSHDPDTVIMAQEPYARACEKYEQNLKQTLTNNKTIYHKNAEDFPLKSNSKGGNDE